MLVEGDADSPLLHATSPLNDHRRFFSYDVKIFHNGTSIGLLSKRLVRVPVANTARRCT